MGLLLDAVRATPGLHPADVERLHALMSDETDPADHSRQAYVPKREAEDPRRGA